MTYNEFRIELLALAAKHGTRAKAAKALGVNAATFGRVMAGKERPGRKLLFCMRMKERMGYYYREGEYHG